MPYRIKARNRQGQSVTRIDQNPNSQPITSHALALETAQLFAETRGAKGEWTGYVEHYDATTSIAADYNNQGMPQRSATRLKPGNVRVP